MLALLALGAVTAAPVGADLQSQIDASRARDRSLQAEISADSRTIDGFQGRIDDVQARLAGIQRSLDIEQAQLDQLRSQLRAARARLVTLRVQLAHDRDVLATELVGQYESSQPDLITRRARRARVRRPTGARRSAQGDRRPEHDDHDARAQRGDRRARRSRASLNDMVVTQQHVTAAQMIQRDEVAQLQFALQARQAPYLHSRARRQAQLASLRSTRQALEKRLASFQVRAAAAYGLGTGVPFTPGGGSYGFFPAPGTNYSVGERAGARAPPRSLGQGAASAPDRYLGLPDPGALSRGRRVRQRPAHARARRQTPRAWRACRRRRLSRFGLTRPFGGAREADHIQLA